MKKTISLLLAILMLASVLALTGCGAKQPDANNDSSADSSTPAPESSSDETPDSSSEEIPDSSDAEPITIGSALDLYTAIWAAYGEDNKFACAGGDADHSAEAPAQFVLNADNADSFKYLLHVTDELYDQLEDDAATLQHMMNTNTFCSAVVKLKDAAQAADFAAAYQASIQSQQWMCGFPDKVAVVQVGDYLVIAYGHEGNIDNLIAACATVDATAAVLVDAPAMVE